MDSNGIFTLLPKKKKGLLKLVFSRIGLIVFLTAGWMQQQS